ncbi:longiborneol synthase [Colletotrichum orchidophilum]|uniref:Longiborneol synthase n=1 Tax=Colletotrichum orchidophilum TaxID=1209926 RepID=A0A1G4ASE9_9PEZI|nr:longiborneol synthase [Colletotrichum orchidophilum]OHE92094.1 longiborneol synthase [Colletotrichum orchidophilum]
MLQSPTIDHADQALRQTLSCLIPTFLNSIDYVSPPEVDKNSLRMALIDRALQGGVHLETDDASQMRFEAGLAVAAEMYPLHPLEIQIHIGLFTWFGFIIDDMNAELGLDLEHFQTRLLVGERQPSALLQSFADNLRSMKMYYDPIVANWIVLSALAFVNSNAIEIRPQYQTIVLTKETVSWPYYFRDKEGLPEVYTYFCFYKALCPDISCFLPAAPEMGRFINLTNDILS